MVHLRQAVVYVDDRDVYGGPLESLKSPEQLVAPAKLVEVTHSTVERRYTLTVQAPFLPINDVGPRPTYTLAEWRKLVAEQEAKHPPVLRPQADRLEMFLDWMAAQQGRLHFYRRPSWIGGLGEVTAVEVRTLVNGITRSIKFELLDDELPSLPWKFLDAVLKLDAAGVAEGAKPVAPDFVRLKRQDGG